MRRLLTSGLILAWSCAYGQQPSPQHALINQYCVTCHNEKAKTAGLMLDKLDIDHAGGTCRDVGKGGAKAARRHDATSGHA